MTAPKPDKLEQLLEEVEWLRLRCLDSYRWAYPIGYGNRSVGDDAWVRHLDATDPTAAVLFGGKRTRDACDTAARLIEEAVKHLRGADNALSGVLSASAGHTPAAWNDGRPRLISADELAEAREAKDRREARGEGWGEA